MSDNAWNKIPDDLKDTFVKAVAEGCEAQWQYLNEATEEAKGNLEGAGVKFYDINLDEMKDAYKAAQEKAGTSFDAEWEAAVDAAKAAVK